MAKVADWKWNWKGVYYNRRVCKLIRHPNLYSNSPRIFWLFSKYLLDTNLQKVIDMNRIHRISMRTNTRLGWFWHNIVLCSNIWTDMLVFFFSFFFWTKCKSSYLIQNLKSMQCCLWNWFMARSRIWSDDVHHPSENWAITHENGEKIWFAHYPLWLSISSEPWSLKVYIMYNLNAANFLDIFIFIGHLFSCKIVSSWWL